MPASAAVERLVDANPLILPEEVLLLSAVAAGCGSYLEHELWNGTEETLQRRTHLPKVRIAEILRKLNSIKVLVPAEPQFADVSHSEFDVGLINFYAATGEYPL